MLDDLTITHHRLSASLMQFSAKGLVFAANFWRRLLAPCQCGSGVKLKFTVAPCRRLRNYLMYFVQPLMLLDHVIIAPVTAFLGAVCE